jgi:hypothetical protein
MSAGLIVKREELTRTAGIDALRRAR